MPDPSSSRRGPSPKIEQKASGTSALADLPEIAALKRRRRRVLWAIVIVFLVAGLSAKPGFAAFKRWRCVKLAEESAGLLKRGETEQAFSRARAAHQLIPQEPQALRAVARVLTARNDWGNAVGFWAEVVKREPTPADRREFVEATLRTGAAPVAAEQVEVLLSSGSNVAENHLVAAKVHAAQRNLDLAVASARKAVELDSGSETASFLLSQLLIQTPETRGEGVERLWMLGERKTVTGLQALALLSTYPELQSEELGRLSAALRANPHAEESHRLKALELDLRRMPERRSELIAAARAGYVSAEPERLRLFASWLSLQGEHALAVEALSAERAFTRKDLLLVRLDAMAALVQWREILDYLGRDRVPLEQPLIHLFQARCWKELDEPERADVAWRSALAAAANDLNTLAYIAGYAEKVGAREHAERAYRTLAQNPKTARFAFEALVRLTEPANTLQLRDLLAEMAQRWPKDVALINDLAYLNTLLEVDLPRNLEMAKKLVETEPQSLPHRTVLALAELRGGNTTAALRVYDGLQINWKAAAPGAVVVYASALRQAGREYEARTLVSTLVAETLRPEERVLLAAIQKP